MGKNFLNVAVSLAILGTILSDSSFAATYTISDPAEVAVIVDQGKYTDPKGDHYAVSKHDLQDATTLLKLYAKAGWEIKKGMADKKNAKVQINIYMSNVTSPIEQIISLPPFQKSIK